MKKQRNIDAFAPSDLWQLIRVHQFFNKTTHINKHQKSMERLIQSKQAGPARAGLGILMILLLASLALMEKAQALSPAPDGGYPGGNTAEGQSALGSLTSGLYNTGIGAFSLLSLTDGNFNTGVGAGTLLLNTAPRNTATGAGALLSNASGEDNTANGAFALFSNTTGFGNTATGEAALLSNTMGVQNTATGVGALHNNTDGSGNAAVGFNALANNTTGGTNTAVGYNALVSNTGGGSNTAVGITALFNNTTGSSNVALGNTAGSLVTTADHVIAIGHSGFNVSDSCYIGNIRGVQTQNADAIPVLIDSSGQLGTASSSRRFKRDIEPMDETSASILALKPVTFHYKSDKKDTPQFGLIAEEVAEVNPDLVARDNNGEVYTVRYDQINAMLLNEFLKEYKRVEAQQATIADLKSTVTQQQKGMEVLTAQLEEQAAQIQKVSAQLAAASPSRGGREMSESAPQIVFNP
jgi:uncharacterized coiled-coil protein SlyX